MKTPEKRSVRMSTASPTWVGANNGGTIQWDGVIEEGTIQRPAVIYLDASDLPRWLRALMRVIGPRLVARGQEGASALQVARRALGGEETD